MTPQEVVHDYLEQVRERIIANQARYGLRASGESAQSIRIEDRFGVKVLIGAAYFKQQEEGRAPGKMPPVEAIYDWLQYQKYGITYSDDKERRSIAFAIAKKISTEGTYRFRRAPLDIIQDAYDNRSELLSSVSAAVKRQMLNNLFQYGTKRKSS